MRHRGSSYFIFRANGGRSWQTRQISLLGLFGYMKNSDNMKNYHIIITLALSCDKKVNSIYML